jgi:hypothetical protein
MKRWATWGLAGLLAAGPAWADKKAEAPTIEAVFVLDTTGSMGGLIEGAKQKIWAIVNEMAKGKPSPKIKLGLVAYRDRGDDYVTQVTPLSANLDAVYSKLLTFQAGGGGDEPEDVRAGLNDAVEKAGWSRGGKVLRVVYLVGDAPPHFDYKDEPTVEAIMKKAMDRNIRVNTIRCGGSPTTAEAWQTIARLGEGKFFTIQHEGGVIAAATPFDGEIAAVERKLETTTLSYGARAAESRREVALGGAMMAAAAPAALADRAAFKEKSGFERDKDLVAAIDSGAVRLDTLNKADLPDELKGKTAAEQKEELEKVRTERKALESKLASLSKKRAESLAESAKNAPADSFDAKVVEALRAQAASAGIAY